MKKLIFVLILIGLASAIYFLTRPEEDVMDHPGIDKFARINAYLAIEQQKYSDDSLAYNQARDSLLKEFDVDSQWIADLAKLLDKQPDRWVEVYDLMIQYAEEVKDSIMHRDQLTRRNADSLADTIQQEKQIPDD